jgi:hypothetical protein
MITGEQKNRLDTKKSYMDLVHQLYYFFGPNNKVPSKEVSLFLRNWNASWMPSYHLQRASSLWGFYM